MVIGHSASGAITAPAGWTQLDHTVQGSIHTHLWTRTYTAGMTGVAQVFSGPTSDYSISVSAYSHAAGASGLTLTDLAVATDGTGSAYPVNIVAPSTASVTDSLLLNFYAWRDARRVTGVTYPAGMTDVFYPNWPYSSSGSAGVAGLTLLTSTGTTGTKTIVVSASSLSYIESVSYSFLINPPPSGRGWVLGSMAMN